MRARLLAATFCAGLLALCRPSPALADADSVLVRVGGNLSARQGGYIDVPITVDLSGAPGRALGSYRATLGFNPAQLEFIGVDIGGFATPEINPSHASDSGTVLLTAIQPSGATGAVVIFMAHFYVISDTGQSPVTIAFDEMSATALSSPTPFENLMLLPFTYVQGVFCRSLGRWGDANGDGQANSLDALVALSAVVGIPVDTTLMNPALTDVDADGRVTSRDALIILSYAVGLPVPGYRVLLTAAGACGTGSAITATITPDSLELRVGQTAVVQFDARDASGRSVSTDSGTLTSSDPSVAVFVEGEGPVVQARAPGVATLTARLGPGVAATLKVVVVARRSRWYVDIERARLAPTQTGTQNLPLEFIGDALNLAHDGDTILVASGTYEEVLSPDTGRAVTVIGDSANRPVIDPRGAPAWYTYWDAIDIEPYTGQIVLANLIVRAGMVYLDAHDFVLRNVRLDGLDIEGSEYAMLELYSENLTLAPAPRTGGPMRSNELVSLGNVLLDNVVVTADSTRNGIVVDQADSVEIRNSSVMRTSAGTNPYCTPSRGILVSQASVSFVHDNVVANPVCQGIGVFDAGYYQLANDVGRATISRNRVTGAPNAGISAGARLIALDHNVVANTGVPGYRTYGYTAGVHVIQAYASGLYITPDSVVSRGDSILNSGGRGFAIDTAATASIDSLVIAGTGQDSSSYGGFGVHLPAGGRFALSHSHISNTFGDNAVYACGSGARLFSAGNRITNAGWIGISVGNCGDRVPDTLVSVSDTVETAWQHGIRSVAWYTRIDTVRVDSVVQYDGIFAPDVAPSGRVLLVNAPSISRVALEGIEAYVDTVQVTGGSIARSGGDGVYAEALRFVTDGVNIDSSAWAGVSSRFTRYMEVRGSSVLRSVLSGIWASHVDTLLVTGNSIRGNGTGEGYPPGLYMEYVTDSARIKGNVFEDNASGVVTFNGSPVVLDSNRVAGSTTTGWYSNNSSAGGRATRNLFLNNQWGVVVDNNTDVNSSLSLARNSFVGNTGGAVVNNSLGGATIDAASNYWGDSRGPSCGVGVTDPNCPITTAGDPIPTNGVTFFPWLFSADPEVAAVRAVMLARRQVPDARIRPLVALPSPRDLDRLHSRAGRPEASRIGDGASAAQESRQPRARPAAPAAAAAPTMAAAVQRQPHQRPPAWHAASKARSHQAHGATKR